MNLQAVTGSAFYATCEGCGDRSRVISADLDGAPFACYYCLWCSHGFVYVRTLVSSGEETRVYLPDGSPEWRAIGNARRDIALLIERWNAATHVWRYRAEGRVQL